MSQLETFPSSSIPYFDFLTISHFLYFYLFFCFGLSFFRFTFILFIKISFQLSVILSPPSFSSSSLFLSLSFFLSFSSPLSSSTFLPLSVSSSLSLSLSSHESSHTSSIDVEKWQQVCPYEVYHGCEIMLKIQI